MFKLVQIYFKTNNFLWEWKYKIKARSSERILKIYFILQIN